MDTKAIQSALVCVDPPKHHVPPRSPSQNNPGDSLGLKLRALTAWRKMESAVPPIFRCHRGNAFSSKGQCILRSAPPQLRECVFHGFASSQNEAQALHPLAESMLLVQNAPSFCQSCRSHLQSPNDWLLCGKIVGFGRGIPAIMSISHLFQPVATVGGIAQGMAEAGWR